MGEKCKEDGAILVMCPAEGCLRRSKTIAAPSVAGARRGLTSRVGWGDMAIGTVASPPACLLGPFGSDVQGGPCCAQFHHTVLVLVR